MRVALIHYWLVGMRGGEKVLEALCRLFPEADVYTHVVDRRNLSDLLNSMRIRTTTIGRLPFAKRAYQSYLPLMPRALEGIDLTGYDLIISSEAGPAKGVITPPDSLHLCYCHSPMRYLWDQYHVYRNSAGLLTRLMMPGLAHKLRMWDVTSAARVDGFMANSTHVARRIEKYWRREADVVHPPVAVDVFAPAPAEEVGDYYLWCGEMASYKRPDVAIEAFNRMGRRLLMIGSAGKARKRLQRLAGPNVELLGRAPQDVVRHHLARCRALIFPGEEDFGIVPVEAMAAGRPVIAWGRGGALDTVHNGVTGLLYENPSVEGLIEAVELFEQSDLTDADPAVLIAHSRQFSEARFRDGVIATLRNHGVELPDSGEGKAERC